MDGDFVACDNVSESLCLFLKKGIERLIVPTFDTLDNDEEVLLIIDAECDEVTVTTARRRWWERDEDTD